MCLLILILPLISSLFVGLFGKYLGFLGSTKLAIFCLLTCLLLVVNIYFEIILYKAPIFIDLFYWIDSEFLNIYWCFVFDSLTITMCFIIVFISFLVHFYSIEYMGHDPFLSKFIAYLSLFTFFMLLLITSNDLIQMFIGWEGVGLCSYLLINFWFIRIQANKAAIKAMLINRIGDFGLLGAILFIFITFKTLNYDALSLLICLFKTNKQIIFDIHIFNIICLLLFIGAVGKSAQLGLHTWLPDAMEGPTPVSALIHAATMVTAGVFLLIRLSFLFENTNKILNLIVIVGILTSSISALVGLTQNDTKKIIAYSTCSQLGYMIFTNGLSDYFISLFHLTNHAFFKALLFLSSGSTIHSINDEQDIRKMGGLKIQLPFTYKSTLIGSLALIGFPYLTGFYSKDFILECTFAKYNLLGTYSFVIGSIGAFITAYYSFRAIFLVFLSKPNGFKNILGYAIESNFNIKFVLSILIIPSIIIGYYSKDLITGFGNNFFNNTIFINLKLFNIFDAEFILISHKVAPTCLSLLGAFLAFYLYFNYTKVLVQVKLIPTNLKIYNFLNRKWYYDKIYNDILGQWFFKFGYSISYKFIDKGIFELLGPNGISFNALQLSNVYNNIQLNYFNSLLWSKLIGFIFILYQIVHITNININLLFINILILLFL